MAKTAHLERTSPGRGDLPARIAHLCADHVGEAVEVLVKLMRSSERDMVRLQAAKCILDAARELPVEEAGPAQVNVYVLQPGEQPPKALNPGSKVIDMAELDAEAEAAFRGRGSD